MKAKSIIIAVSGLMLIGLTMSSCRKEEFTKETAQDELSIIKSDADHSEAEMAASDIDMICDGAQGEPSSDRSSSPVPCATITKDSVTIPGTMLITVDFGTGCTGPDGKVRKGIIHISQQGRHFHPGSIRTVTFDNYYVNNNKVEGTRTVTNVTGPGAPLPTWHIVATNMKLTKANGSIHQWNSDRTRIMVAGAATHHDRSDDAFDVIGDWNGIRPNGANYIATITQPLHKANNCQWISSGKIEFRNVQNNKTRILDFGNGTCDNQATVTKGNNTHTITLH